LDQEGSGISAVAAAALVEFRSGEVVGVNARGVDSFFSDTKKPRNARL
jgi:hypothetical protein